MLALSAVFLFACSGGGSSSSSSSLGSSSASGGSCSGSNTLSASGGSSITISGTAQYENRTYDKTGFTGVDCLPIRYAKVQVMQNGAVSASAVTDASGNFSVSSGIAAGSVYVRVVSDAGSPFSAIVQDNRDSSTYSVRSADITAKSGETWTAKLAASVTDVGQVFNIFDNIIKTQDVLKNLSGTAAPLITAYWYSGKTEGTYYSYSGAKHIIDLLGKTTDSDAYDDSVILHEMGHYAAQVYSKDSSPGGTHRLTGHYDIRLTWSEGWASFFGSLVKSKYSEATPQWYVDTNGTSGTGASTLLFSFDIDTPSYSTLAVGADNEVAVSNVLWHIYASPADSTHLALGSDKIWKVFGTDIPAATTADFETFYDKWVANAYPSLAALLADRAIKYAADSYESDNTAGTARTIAAGTSEVHTFFPASDVDWFQISVTSGATYSFTTSALGDGADTLLTLYDTNGTTQLAQSDDIDSTTKASKITWVANATKTVYIKCEPYRPLVSGDILYSASASNPVAVVKYGYYTIAVSSP